MFLPRGLASRTPCEQTNRCKNIAFPQLPLVGGNNIETHCSWSQSKSLSRFRAGSVHEPLAMMQWTSTYSDRCQTCSKFFNLDLTTQGPPSPPLHMYSFYLCTVGKRFVFYWNAFLFLVLTKQYFQCCRIIILFKFITRL